MYLVFMLEVGFTVLFFISGESKAQWGCPSLSLKAHEWWGGDFNQPVWGYTLYNHYDRHSWWPIQKPFSNLFALQDKSLSYQRDFWYQMLDLPFHTDVP
jgi:hypothetical protein